METEFSKMKVVVDFIYPPIPDRNFDYAAHFDDAEGLVGYGATKEAATADLKTQFEEQ